MTDGYISLEKSGFSEYTEKKSVFFGYAAPVSTEEEAIAFVKRIKEKHSDARHNVYAYVLRENNAQRFSDDGEPHGTAGLPLLDTLRKQNITDAVIVVTRYFGGILLGTGGLVRAYSTAAKDATADAGVVSYILYKKIKLSVSYSDYQKLVYFLAAHVVGERVCSIVLYVTFVKRKIKSQIIRIYFSHHTDTRQT
jgi:uncharacterized YigZ family protein